MRERDLDRIDEIEARAKCDGADFERLADEAGDEVTRCFRDRRTLITIVRELEAKVSRECKCDPNANGIFSVYCRSCGGRLVRNTST